MKGALIAGSALVIAAFSCGAAATKEPNLALRATASATSEHNDQYLARFAIDGKIPFPGAQDDPGQAWCVQGHSHRGGAEFVLEWPEPVTVAQVVYWGRTSWFAEECWKDYELMANDRRVAHGRFQMGHGPQPIRLEVPVVTKQLRLRFTSSYGGLNPGAAEIQVFEKAVPDAALAKFHSLPAGRPEIDNLEIEHSAQLAERLQTGKFGFEQLLLIQRRELNPSHVYTYHVEGFGAGGGLYLYDLDGAAPGSQGGLKRLVDSPEGQILDCDLSYDGTEILFSWRRRQHEGYQVFAVDKDGGNLRQLTSGPHHNYNACWLPDGGIAFLSTRSSRFAYCWISPVGILHRMERDGAGVTQLSANIVNDFTPNVLNDGRILYSRWEYVDKPAIPIQSLWTIHPNGTGLAGFFGNRVLSPATFMEARPIPGSHRVLCVLTSHNGPCRGAIGMIDVAKGNNASSAIVNLTPEVNIGLVDQGDGNHIRGPYENPYPVDEEHFLVSRRGTVLFRRYDGVEVASVIKPRDGLGFYSPQPLRSRTVPPVLAAQTAQVSARVRPAEDAEEVQWSTVFVQDVYRGLEPHVKRGDVKEICVVEEMRKAVRTDVNNRAFGFQFPVISCGATYAAKRVWGYADVAEDGSACFQVPSGRPIYFMALDAQGRAVQRMRTFTHLMPGEVQGCVGCHEPRQQTAGAVVRRSRLPDRLRAPEWGERVGFDYTTIVQPVLDAHCVKCHSGPTPPKKVDLAGDKTDFFNVSYEWLARGRKKNGDAEWDSPYVNWIPTYNGMEQNILEVTPKAWGSPKSRVTDILLSGHPNTNGVARVKMEQREVRRILAWIDLNVPYYGTSETAYPDKPGCRQMYPAELDKTLADVVSRRCVACHDKGQIPRGLWTRINNPQLNTFLTAPLAKAAGGSEACGKPVFQDVNDPDYQAVLRTFEPVAAQLRERPRMDMPNATPAAVDRNCLGSL